MISSDRCLLPPRHFLPSLHLLFSFSPLARASGPKEWGIVLDRRHWWWVRTPPPRRGGGAAPPSVTGSRPPPPTPPPRPPPPSRTAAWSPGPPRRRCHPTSMGPPPMEDFPDPWPRLAAARSTLRRGWHRPGSRPRSWWSSLRTPGDLGIASPWPSGFGLWGKGDGSEGVAQIWVGWARGSIYFVYGCIYFFLHFEVGFGGE